jgi:hypothetical protein
MQNSSFYDAGPLKQIAIDLFYGWGYNFYRRENQLRADDQLIRAKASLLLAQAHASLELAERSYRRDHLPAPSRAQPFADPAAIKGAQHLERLACACSALAERLHAQPAPENDRMTERYRNEATTLIALGHADERLIGQAELLRQRVEGRSGEWLIANGAEVQTGLDAIAETLRGRQLILS